MLHSPNDPGNLTPDQRRREIAAILARGVLRLRCMRQTDPAPRTRQRFHGIHGKQP